MDSNKNEIWLEAARSPGDFAGVLEFDGETCYFYLCEIAGEDDRKIVEAIHVTSKKPDFGETDLEIRWSDNEAIVGLFIRSRLWAAFDTKSRSKYGGNYHSNALPVIPDRIAAVFN